MPHAQSTAAYDPIDDAVVRSSHFFLGFPDLLRAIATACFCGLPAAFNSRMFLLTVLLLLPGLSGILHPHEVKLSYVLGSPARFIGYLCHPQRPWYHQDTSIQVFVRCAQD